MPGKRAEVLRRHYRGFFHSDLLRFVINPFSRAMGHWRKFLSAVTPQITTAPGRVRRPNLRCFADKRFRITARTYESLKLLTVAGMDEEVKVAEDVYTSNR